MAGGNKQKAMFNRDFEDYNILKTYEIDAAATELPLDTVQHLLNYRLT